MTASNIGRGLEFRGVVSGISVTANVTDAGTGTATSGADYTAFGTQPVRSEERRVGKESRTRTLTETDDKLLEGRETVKLTLGRLGGSAVSRTVGYIANVNIS